MSLTTILQEMDTNRPNAEMDVQMGSPATYGGRVGLKRAATETLKRLRLQYRNELMSSTIFIVVSGADRDTFTNIASTEDFGCFSTDPDSFYKDLVSKIDPSLFGREGVRHLFNIVGNVLEDKMMELDIGSYNMLAFNETYNTGVRNAADFAVLVKRAVNEKVGSEIVGINAINSIVDRAIAKNHAATVTPVLLNTGDEAFAMDLYKNLKRLTPKVFLVVAGKSSKELRLAEGSIFVKTTNESNVGEALSTIRNKI